MQQLLVSPRTITGSKVKQLRKNNIIPANIYNRNADSISIQVDSKTFSKLYSEIGQSSVVDLHIQGSNAKHPCFIADVQYNPITNKINHIDFRQVSLKEKVTLNVPIEFVGESLAVKDGAMLVTLISELEVEALPTEVPESIIADITKLQTVDDEILVSDLQFDRTKVTIYLDADTLIARAEIAEMDEIIEDQAPIETEIISETQKQERDSEKQAQED